MPFTATTNRSPSANWPLYPLPKVNTIFIADQDETMTPMQEPLWPFESPENQGPTVVGSEKASSASG